MGHVRLGVLPRSQEWAEVVGLLRSGAADLDVAGASARAAESALAKADSDPVFAECVWLLTNLPLAARDPEHLERLNDLGVAADHPPTLLELTANVSRALDDFARRNGARTDLGEMAQTALVESLTDAIAPQLPSLFTPEPAEVRTALGRLSQGDRFAGLARDFFARVTHASLDYYLSRELAAHIGAGERFASDVDRRAFDRALQVHCREASRIVEAYAGGWYGKTVWREGCLTRETSQKFARYAFKKIRDELGRRRDAS
jgi:hypothetical protein